MNPDEKSSPNGVVLGQWSSGLCDCFSDPSTCCLTWCCPCITFGRIAEIADKGSTSCAFEGCFYYFLSCAGIACIYSCGFRHKLRSLFSLEESPCDDCLVHCCCMSCALCQEYRELKNRGVDPSIGWQANVERWNRGQTVAPKFASGMKR